MSRKQKDKLQKELTEHWNNEPLSRLVFKHPDDLLLWHGVLTKEEYSKRIKERNKS